MFVGTYRAHRRCISRCRLTLILEHRKRSNQCSVRRLGLRSPSRTSLPLSPFHGSPKIFRWTILGDYVVRRLCGSQCKDTDATKRDKGRCELGLRESIPGHRGSTQRNRFVKATLKSSPAQFKQRQYLSRTQAEL